MTNSQSVSFELDPQRRSESIVTTMQAALKALLTPVIGPCSIIITVTRRPPTNAEVATIELTYVTKYTPTRHEPEPSRPV
jgi:hypothetical protein